MDDPLPVHSVTEACLYLLATPCSKCGRGPLSLPGGSPTGIAEPPRGLQWAEQQGSFEIDAACQSCGARARMAFSLPGGSQPGDQLQAPVINTTGEPSRILDVAQWITLYRMLVDAGGRDADQVHARRLAVRAAQCLEEAMKFYDDPENDLPPPEAFFSNASRERFRESPEQFSRQRLIELRAKLPGATALRSEAQVVEKRPWWRWWR